MALPRLAYRTLTCNATPQAVTAPIDCDYVTVQNIDSSLSVTMQTAYGDTNTNKTLAAGVQEILDSPFRPQPAIVSNFSDVDSRQRFDRRFQAGDIVMWVSASSGSPQVTVSFLL